MRRQKLSVRWGEPPWQIDFRPRGKRLPDEVDIAIIGGGFTGLAAAACLRGLAPKKTVVLLEANKLGAGASGRTGGIVMEGTAAGDLPGLGDVLQGLKRILQELKVDCELRLRGVWEIGRRDTRVESPIEWWDSGMLRVANEVAGGTVDPGKLLSGLGQAAERLGAIVCENAPVRSVRFREPLALHLPGTELRAQQVLLATNARSLELSGIAGRGHATFSIAVATAPLDEDQLEALGLGERKAFYTIDLPYLWGRVLASGAVVFGSGLVHLEDWREMDTLDIACGEPAQLVGRLERRIRGLHEALRSVEFTHRWGGPILFTPAGRPYFSRHPQSDRALVVGGYSGHGVALSVYLGCWAAEALLGQSDLPRWGDLAS